MKSYLVHTDNATNPEGELVGINSLEEYKEYLRKEYSNSSCCFRAIEDLVIIEDFRDQIGYHNSDASSPSCKECGRENDWWQVTYVKVVKKEINVDYEGASKDEKSIRSECSQNFSEEVLPVNKIDWIKYRSVETDDYVKDSIQNLNGLTADIVDKLNEINEKINNLEDNAEEQKRKTGRFDAFLLIWDGKPYCVYQTAEVAQEVREHLQRLNPQSNFEIHDLDYIIVPELKDLIKEGSL